MTKDEKAALIMEAMEDQDFASKLFSAETAEEAIAIFASRGIELSMEELEEMKEASSQESGEISEEDLAAVAGGIRLIGTGCVPITWPPILIPRGPWPFRHKVIW